MKFDGGWFLYLPVLVFSVVVHECAHGLMALWRGDPTAKERGRLTLNPLPHIDWFGSLVLPAVLLLSGSKIVFGWAKPVPINWANLRSPRNDQVRVALAGPASNLLLALLFTALLAVSPPTGFWSGLGRMAAFGVLLNCALAVLNMIPIPPLDGSWLLLRFLPVRHLYVLQQFRLLALAGLILLLTLPKVSYYAIQLPVVTIAELCLRVFGVPAQRLLEMLS